jgi:hypothetical protein
MRFPRELIEQSRIVQVVEQVVIKCSHVSEALATT